MAETTFIGACIDQSGEQLTIARTSSDKKKGAEPIANVPAGTQIQLEVVNDKTKIVDPKGLDAATVKSIEENVKPDETGQFNSAVMNANAKYKEERNNAAEQAAKLIQPTPHTAMTENVSGYGMNLSKLMWPRDIQSKNMDIPYTMFYISEHQDATIAKNANNHAAVSQYPPDAKHIPGSQLSETFASMNEPDLKTIKEGYKDVSKIAIAGGSAWAAYKATNGLVQGGIDVIKGVLGFASPTASAAVGNAVQGVGTTASATAGATVGLATYNSNLSRVGIKTDYVRLNTCIVLPTPTLTSSSTFEWEASNSFTGTLFSGMMHLGPSAINAVKGATKKITDHWSNVNLDNPNAGMEAVRALGQTVKAPLNVADKLAANTSFGDAATAWGMSTGDTALGNAMGRIAGVAANTRKEQSFEDVQFRTYEFKYTMFARSQAEMESIQSIIKVFKYHAHPELSPSTFLYTYPAQFDIVHYYKGEVNPYLPRHATSVLTAVDVTYGEGENMTITHDGAPTIITLSLKFIELAIINRQDIERGY